MENRAWRKMIIRMRQLEGMARRLKRLERGAPLVLVAVARDVDHDRIDLGASQLAKGVEVERAVAVRLARACDQDVARLGVADGEERLGSRVLGAAIGTTQGASQCFARFVAADGPERVDRRGPNLAGTARGRD